MNKYLCLWIGWGSTELHRGLGFKLWRPEALPLTETPRVIGAVVPPMSLPESPRVIGAVVPPMSLTESPCVIGAVVLHMSLLVRLEITVQAPICMQISWFPLHCIYYYSNGQMKSNG